jgi:hypothetical protein
MPALNATLLPEVAYFGSILPEDYVRDQLSAAEELLFTGHREPALVAAGAGVEGALRLAAGHAAGEEASAGALLEALLAAGSIDERENELLFSVLCARDRLVHGLVPLHLHSSGPQAVIHVVKIALRLLEPASACELEHHR